MGACYQGYDGAAVILHVESLSQRKAADIRSSPTVESRAGVRVLEVKRKFESIRARSTRAKIGE